MNVSVKPCFENNANGELYIYIYTGQLRSIVFKSMRELRLNYYYRIRVKRITRYEKYITMSRKRK